MKVTKGKTVVATQQHGGFFSGNQVSLLRLHEFTGSLFWDRLLWKPNEEDLQDLSALFLCWMIPPLWFSFGSLPFLLGLCLLISG